MILTMFIAQMACFAYYLKNREMVFLLLPLSIMTVILEYRYEKKKKSINTWQLSRLLLLAFISFLLFINYFVNIF